MDLKVVAALTLGLCLAGVPALAAEPSMAVFPIDAALRSTEKLARQAESALINEALSRGLVVVSGNALARKVRRPGPTWERCRDEVGCLAKLGKKAGTSQVLVVRATPAARSVRIAFTVIDVASATVLRRGTFDVAKNEAIDVVVASQADAIFGGASDGQDLDLAMPALEDLAAPTSATSTGASDDFPDLLPLETLEPASTAEADALADADTPGDDPQGEKPPDRAESITVVPAPNAAPPSAKARGADELALAPPPGLEPAPESGPYLLIAGLTALGAGAIAGGTGAAFGLMLEDARSRAAATNASGQLIETGQTALELERAGRDHAQNANIMFGVAGTLGVIGAVLILVDLTMGPDGDREPGSTRVEPGAGSVIVRF